MTTAAAKCLLQVAHGILFSTHEAFVAAAQPLPAPAAHSLMLLHSYLLVRLLVRMGDHLVRHLLSYSRLRNIR